MEKIDALGFEKEQIEAVVKKGVKWKEEKRDIWHANMGNIEVVFAKSDNDVVIITVYEARWEK
ncbi:DUF4258 domain-containing protein [Candidatus Woesearchaeota archaeon]|nr:DUF4258 domain-containing protein [Candidatus Woesearchaeota archaeon]